MSVVYTSEVRHFNEASIHITDSQIELFIMRKLLIFR